MDQKEAKAIAKILDGEVIEWPKDDDFAVRLKGHDEQIVVISDQYICQFEDEEFFEEGNATETFTLAS